MKTFIRRFVQKRKGVKNTGKKVIIRGDRSGVFFGTLEGRSGQEARLSNCRRLWSWNGACSISQIAIDGVARPDNCKFTVVVPEIEIIDCIEIIPCADKAIISIEEVAIWRM